MLLDDIQFGRAKGERRTSSSTRFPLYTANKQIVIACDGPEGRLFEGAASRFESLS